MILKIVTQDEVDKIVEDLIASRGVHLIQDPEDKREVELLILAALLAGVDLARKKVFPPLEIVE